jgi:hypothetical protein
MQFLHGWELDATTRNEGSGTWLARLGPARHSRTRSGGPLFEHLRQFVDEQAGGPARRAVGSGANDAAVAAKPPERTTERSGPRSIPGCPVGRGGVLVFRGYG